MCGCVCVHVCACVHVGGGGERGTCCMERESESGQYFIEREEPGALLKGELIIPENEIGELEMAKKKYGEKNRIQTKLQLFSID